MADRSEYKPSSFKAVLDKAREESTDANDQNAKRHYSEVLSAGVAEWIAGVISGDDRVHKVESGEYPIQIAGGSKRLDVACIDANGYLALDLSIKTFNFKNKAGTYKHNFTGRSYELLGESLDLRRSYPHAILGALIFLPQDGCFDSTKRAPSSFGHAVKKFSNICTKPNVSDDALLFDYAFIGLHNPDGVVYFFDSSKSPPWCGEPDSTDRLSLEQVADQVLELVDSRSKNRHCSTPNLNSDFRWSDR